MDKTRKEEETPALQTIIKFKECPPKVFSGAIFEQIARGIRVFPWEHRDTDICWASLDSIDYVYTEPILPIDLEF